MKKVVLTFLITALGALGTILRAQNNAISGTVRNAYNGKPLAGANVYLDKTTIGTTVNKNGYFNLKDIPNGLYQLVISFVGFESFSKQVNIPNSKIDSLSISLKPKTDELKEVTVTANNNWEENLAKFKRYFIGRSTNAEKTTILNPLDLRFNQTDTEFTATSVKPMVIENKALGYQITFYLQKFVFNGRTYATFGHSKYKRLKPKNKKQSSKWMKARKRVYHNSFRHFIHALTHHSLRKEGYGLHYTNHRRQKLDKKYSLKIHSPDQLYRKISSHQISFAFTKDFKYLRIDYYKGRLPEQLAKQIPHDKSSFVYQLSWIKLPNDKAVIDVRTGSQIQAYPAILYGYWSYFDVIPNRLPANYQPPD